MIKQVGFSILHSIFDHSIFNSGVCSSFYKVCVCCLYRRVCFAQNLDDEQSMGFVVSCRGREREYGTSTRTGRRGREEEEEEEEEEDEGRRQGGEDGKQRRKEKKRRPKPIEHEIFT